MHGYQREEKKKSVTTPPSKAQPPLEREKGKKGKRDPALGLSVTPLLPDFSGLAVLDLAGVLVLGSTGGAVHVLDNTLGRSPVGALPGGHVQHVHGVDFLEGATLGLVDEEEHDEDTGQAAAGEDVAVGEVNGTGDERGEEGDEEVPGPVGGGSNTNARGTVTRRIHFRAYGPDNRAPSTIARSSALAE